MEDISLHGRTCGLPVVLILRSLGLSKRTVLFNELRLSRGPQSVLGGQDKIISLCLHDSHRRMQDCVSLYKGDRMVVFVLLFFLRCESGELMPLLMHRDRWYISTGFSPRTAHLNCLANAIIGFVSHFLTSINICSPPNCPFSQSYISFLRLVNGLRWRQ